VCKFLITVHKETTKTAVNKPRSLQHVKQRYWLHLLTVNSLRMHLLPVCATNQLTVCQHFALVTLLCAVFLHPTNS